MDQLDFTNGQPRCIVRINVAGSHTITADFNSKSVRKAISAIKENSVEECTVILQGKLAVDNTLAEAGLTVQLKAKAEAPA